MEIQLYKNNSSDIETDKLLTPVTTISGTLKEECSIVYPEILVSGSSQFINVNYAYIPEYNRYYFIENITIVKNGLYRLSLHVDVLMSFKEDIRATRGIVARQETNYNKDLVDNELPVTNNVEIYNYTFGAQPFNNGNYVVAIATGFEKRGE